MPAIHTLKTLSDQVMNYLDQAGLSNTTKNVVYDTLRRVHNSRLAERKWNFMLWPAQLSITTAPGLKWYSLHQEFLRPFYFYNNSTKRTMEQRTVANLLPVTDDVPDFDTGLGTDPFNATGSAYRYLLTGVTQVQNQPTSASVLTVSGEVLRTVTVKGETDQGDVTTETITVGTPGSVMFTKILQVIKGDNWAQTMTLTSNGGAVTNLKLRADEYGRQYRQLELVNIPTGVETLYYRFYRKPTTLDSDNSIPDIPAPFSEVLVYDALFQIGSYNRDLDSNSKALWSAEQFRLEQGLLEYDEGPDAVGSGITYQPYVPRD